MKYQTRDWHNTTAGSWAGETIDATNSGGIFTLASNPLFDSGNNLGEQFLLNVQTASFAGLDINNTSTWGSTPWTGDFIVRGVNGGSVDGFSTNQPFTGTATLNASSVPDSASTLAMLGLALVGLVGFRKKLGA